MIEIPEMSNEWSAEARTLSMMLSQHYRRAAWSADDCVRVDSYRRQLIWLLADEGFLQPLQPMRERQHPVLGTTYMERVPTDDVCEGDAEDEYEWATTVQSTTVLIPEDRQGQGQDHDEDECYDDDWAEEWSAEESDEWSSE
jgi:hypothetical protein